MCKPKQFVAPSTISAAVRLAGRINRNGPIPVHRPDLGPCHIWTGCITKKGYAERVRIDGVRIQPYRLLWEEQHGPMPAGTVPDHLCRVRPCVNPDHIEPVTSRVNTLRGDTIVAAAAARTECPSGHPYNEANTRMYQGRRYCRACNNNGGSGRASAVKAVA